MNMGTQLGNLLRHFADLADRGECGIDAATLQKTTELHLLDHQRINILTEAVNVLMKDKQKPKATKVKLVPRNDKR